MAALQTTTVDTSDINSRHFVCYDYSTVLIYCWKMAKKPVLKKKYGGVHTQESISCISLPGSHGGDPPRPPPPTPPQCDKGVYRQIWIGW